MHTLRQMSRLGAMALLAAGCSNATPSVAGPESSFGLTPAEIQQRDSAAAGAPVGGMPAAAPPIGLAPVMEQAPPAGPLPILDPPPSEVDSPPMVETTPVEPPPPFEPPPWQEAEDEEEEEEEHHEEEWDD